MILWLGWTGWPWLVWSGPTQVVIRVSWAARPQWLYVHAWQLVVAIGWATSPLLMAQDRELQDSRSASSQLGSLRATMKSAKRAKVEAARLPKAKSWTLHGLPTSATHLGLHLDEGNCKESVVICHQVYFLTSLMVTELSFSIGFLFVWLVGWLVWFSEMGSHCFAQAGLECLGSSDPPTSSFQVLELQVHVTMSGQLVCGTQGYLLGCVLVVSSSLFLLLLNSNNWEVKSEVLIDWS